MDKDEVIVAIMQSLSDFYKYDKALVSYTTIDHGCCERTISFRIALYLQKYIPNYNVDCEYNRMENAPKSLGKKLVYPDIIVHKRNTKNNISWIEVKKTASRKNKINKDRNKLCNVTSKNSELKYKYGFLIVIADTLENSTIEVYENGKYSKDDDIIIYNNMPFIE